MLAAVLLVTGATLFLVACGRSEETTAETASSVGQSGSIAFAGLVDHPGTLTVLDMDYMYWITITAEHPQLGATEYEGVLLGDIFSYIGVRSGATTLAITASDGSTVKIPLADITSEDAMIAVNGDGTMSTVMPGMASEAWVDDVVRMELE